MTRAVRALARLRDLFVALDCLRDAAIEAVAIKGPMFSHWLYGDAAARDSADLDLLIDARDRFRALALFLDRGYQLPSGMSAGAARIICGPLGAWPLKRDETTPLDVHWEIGHRRFGRPLEVPAVIRDAVRASFQGRTVRIPSPTHAAEIALLHAAWHTWCSPDLLHQIAALMRREDVDWESIAAWGAGAGVSNAVSAGVRVAADLFSVDIPRPLAGPVTSDVQTLCACARQALAQAPGVFPDRRAERRMHRLAMDRMRARSAYELWRLFAPTRKEWDWWPLPDALVGLYVPLRPVRLICQAISTQS
jgi:hypothetical protein